MVDREPAAGSAGRRPTVSSVAEQAGVSRQTVSNALNNPERLQPETLDRVLAAIEETGYVRSAAARQMRTTRSNSIGYRLDPVTDGIGGLVLDSFLHSLTVEAERQDYRIILYTAESDEAELRQFGRLTQARTVDAFVLIGTHQDDLRYAWLREHSVPFAVFGRPWAAHHATKAAEHAWIDVDGAAGTRQATQHLLDLGHRAIGFIGWPAGSGTGDERRRGWEEAKAGAGTPPRRRRALEAARQDGILGGADAAEQLRAAGATALVCASDSLAVGAFGAVQAAGSPIAVVGFDDSPTAAALGISSVRQPLEAAARWSVTTVRDQIRGPDPGHRPHGLLAPELVVRSSSIPPEAQ